MRDISYFSSQGPTRDGKQPEVSAPGHDILAANSLTQELPEVRNQYGGTARDRADSLADAGSQRKLTIAEIRDAVMVRRATVRLLGLSGIQDMEEEGSMLPQRYSRSSRSLPLRY